MHSLAQVLRQGSVRIYYHITAGFMIFPHQPCIPHCSVCIGLILTSLARTWLRFVLFPVQLPYEGLVSRGVNPSENRHRENLSDYEFIRIERCRPEDLQRESEKVTRVQSTSDNSVSVPLLEIYRSI